ncbi:MAG TPA: glycosyltransferase family 39 protein [Solirubrobacteraceae bacterium]|nr:glycosyltransferase family 39 protein [Solirubrobacteraceae bacterium]
MTRARWWLLGAILVVGAVLRLEAISAHLSDAEGYSYLVGSAPSASAFLHRLAAYENTPPLFYLLLTPLALGHTAWLRVPAAIPGALIPLALYAAVRRPLGTRAALLAAAMAAVAPFAVSYSDYARGFMLEGLACIVALWAVVRLADGTSSRWWWLVYLGAAVVALYTEYIAIIFLVALLMAALAWGRRDRLRTAALGVLPLAALLPWAGQFERAQDALNRTKVSPTFPGPSLGSLRDVSVRLVVGEHGAGASASVRWLEFVVVVAALVVVALLLRRGTASDPSSPATRAVLVIATTAALVVIGSALAPAFGTEIFNERYLTVLIPLGGALVAAAVDELDARSLWVGASLAVVIVGVAVFVQRFGREYEPDLAPVRRAVAALHPRMVLTNSAVVAYYLRRLPVVVDRPFGLGPGRAGACPSPCVIVEDTRVPGGVRPGPEPSRLVGPFDVRLVR